MIAAMPTINSTKPSPVMSRKHGWLSMGEHKTDLISFYGRPGVAQAGNTLNARQTLESLGLIASGGGVPVLVTATSDGLTTGIIPDYAEFVIVTSSSSSNKVTLPTPTPGRPELRIYNAANGFKLQTTAPATIAINGGTGSTASSAIAANTMQKMNCVTATAWLGTSVSSVGATTAVAVAS